MCIKPCKETSLQYRLLFLMTPSERLTLLNNDLTLQVLQHTAHSSQLTQHVILSPTVE